ncbi:hypothetical protein TSUD_19260 [Trifolium subterraneum]|uniref:Uncharacterized protein n=1 Tax=Trifolium subterraneum TaxID=3900 RepID=A0A2Z6MI39_TRISU|nr:hypothetical protein TSUD_19260 [Trifolium subterraneum]
MNRVKEKMPAPKPLEVEPLEVEESEDEQQHHNEEMQEAQPTLVEDEKGHACRETFQNPFEEQPNPDTFSRGTSDKFVLATYEGHILPNVFTPDIIMI